jgi:16S rRNA (uracil1498-N3)-methyltransferase
MARRRFFVPEVHNQQAELLEDEARHLTSVLRVEAGQRYEISDNQDVYLAEVAIARKNRVVFQVIEKLIAEPPLLHVHVFTALLKFERLELLFEKATELGVEEITLLQTVRSEHGLEKAADKRMVRWNRILMESSQQSRRARLPILHPPVKLSGALSHTAAHRLFLDEERTGIPLLKAVPDLRSEESVSVMLGPEGGWTDEERSAAGVAGWTPISLGPQILRAETAAIAALAVLNAAALR